MFEKKKNVIKKRNPINYTASRDRVIGIGSKRKSEETGRRSSFWAGLIFWLALISFFGAIIYSLFFSGFLEIAKIDISGNEKISREIIQETVVEKIQGNYFRFFSKNNFFLFPARSIREELIFKQKIIQSVEIERIFPDKINIHIKERAIALAIETDQGKMMVDGNGQIFDKINSEDSYLNQNDFPIFFDERRKNFSLGEEVFSKDYLNFISDFRQKVFADLGIVFDREIRTPVISSGDIRMKTQAGWWIYTDQILGAEKEMGMLKIVWNNKIEENKRQELEYIDLRIQNKVFYRFRNQPQKDSEEKTLPQEEELKKEN